MCKTHAPYSTFYCVKGFLQIKQRDVDSAEIFKPDEHFQTQVKTLIQNQQLKVCNPLKLMSLVQCTYSRFNYRNSVRGSFLSVIFHHVNIWLTGGGAHLSLKQLKYNIWNPIYISSLPFTSDSRVTEVKYTIDLSAQSLRSSSLEQVSLKYKRCTEDQTLFWSESPPCLCTSLLPTVWTHCIDSSLNMFMQWSIPATCDWQYITN